MERMGSRMKTAGEREQIAAALTDESGGWSLACEMLREQWLWFVEAGVFIERILSSGAGCLSS